MKVILEKLVPKLGSPGEVKEVRAGYGRNYLIPRHLAVLYSKGAQRAVQIRQEFLVKKLAVLAKESMEFKNKIEKIKLEFPILVDQKGDLYGSIGKARLIRALKDKGLVLPAAARFELAQPLKQLGDFDVPVRLHPQVVAQLKVTLTKSQAS